MRDKKREIHFGTLAVERGFITGRQLGRAVSVQMKEDLGQDIHRFLGEILIDMGFIDPSQVEEVLQALKQQRPSK
jgi:hypothetical protein